MIGQDLLHYHIESQLGVGGMGEVYQARDTKLGRSVAVKVLPEIFAKDPERVSRFEREAKLLASLNHGNIAALYGLEQVGGRHFLVMELVEGDTLVGRIGRGPIPIEEALKISLQIIEALEAAHEKSVIHRDLKPANIKITPEGKVKVLDFGLAKAMEVAPVEIDRMNSPTLSVVATNAGVILGTAGYMSPEQAKGRSADQRSDIFSFGCVLYEMLTGRTTFDGETVTEVIASVLKQEADLTLLPANTHSRVVELIRRCLAKDAKRRWHAAGDVRVEIETILAESRGLKGADSAPARRPVWQLAAAIAATVLVVGLATAGITWNLRPKPTASISRFSFFLPDGQAMTRGGRPTIVISPDGENIVYQADRQLYLRPMSSVDARPIEGTRLDAGNPFFSPDGKWVGFFSVSEGQLKKVAITGGAAVTVATAEFPFGAHWTPDNQILMAYPQKGIFRVSADGGTPEVLIAAKTGELMHGPQLLPDRDHVLFTLRVDSPGLTTSTASRWDKARIVVQSIKTGERKTLMEGGADARYVPSGHLVYALGSTILAIPFDVSTLEKTGGPTPVLQNVGRAFNASAAAQFSFADNGAMVYFVETGTSDAETKVAFVSRDGKQEPLPLPAGRYVEPRISPDGKQLAVAVGGDDGELFLSVYDLSQSSALRRLTFQTADHPLWARDSKRIIFDSGGALFWQSADGNIAAEELAKGGPNRVPTAVSPDGKTLLYRGGSGGTLGDIESLSLEGERTIKPLISDPLNQQQAYFSPDGRWIVYASTQTGESQIFVQPFPPNGTKHQITTERGSAPLWSPDGKQIFFMTQVGAIGRLTSVDVHTQSGFRFANPTMLPISGIAIHNSPVRSYDITPDGKRFVAVFAESNGPVQAAGTQMRITLNWFEELRQRVK